jgi:predicted membrane protein
MTRSKEIALVAVSTTALVLLNDPFLSTFNLMSFNLGIPILYLSLFVVWLGIIVCTFLIVRKSKNDNE